MQLSRSIVAIALMGLVAAACGGGSATQAPGGATQGPGSATTVPGPTQGGGGGGGTVNDKNGKVHIEIRGPVEKTGDYGFLPAGSIFGGTAGSTLNFTNEGSNEIVSISIGPDGAVVVSYAGTDMSVPASQCTTSNWNIGSTSASGSFECNAGFAIISGGAMVQGVTVKGNFDAHT